MKPYNTSMGGEERRVLSETGLALITLFTSSGTLVCCALPIALVSIAGLGAVLASIIQTFPFIIVLSQHKGWVFGVSGLMILMAGWLVLRPEQTCPVDPTLARWCGRLRRWNRRLLWVSLGIWAVGFTAAFLALPIRMALGI